MMKDFSVCLSLAYQAHNEEEALEIAKFAKKIIESLVPYNIEIDIDDLEEF